MTNSTVYIKYNFYHGKINIDVWKMFLRLFLLAQYDEKRYIRILYLIILCFGLYISSEGEDEKISLDRSCILAQRIHRMINNSHDIKVNDKIKLIRWYMYFRSTVYTRIVQFYDVETSIIKNDCCLLSVHYLM